MLVNLALLAIIAATAVRTFVYSIYCFKKSGALGGMSVMFLFVFVVLAGVGVIMNTN